MKRFKVTEKKITVEETIEALEQGRIKEVFASGTAVIVGPVKSLTYDGKKYNVKVDEKINAGPLTKEIYDKIIAIQVLLNIFFINYNFSMVKLNIPGLF